MMMLFASTYLTMDFISKLGGRAGAFEKVSFSSFYILFAYVLEGETD